MYSEPWHLTIVRTQGLLFIRPEKSWRPVVFVSVVGSSQTHEVVLGFDGQNPNLKSPFVLHDVDHDTRLDIKVWHKSQKNKNRKKRHLVGSAYVLLREVVRRQEKPGADVSLRLSCLPPQKKSHTIGGKQKHSAALTVRLYAPPPAYSSSSNTPIGSPGVSDAEEEYRSDYSSFSNAHSDTLVPTEGNNPSAGISHDIDIGVETSQIRKRRKRQSKGYCIDSDDNQDDTSSCDESSGPPTPRDSYSPPFSEKEYDEYEGEKQAASATIPVLPRYSTQLSLDNSLSFAESVIDSFSPYAELRDAVHDEEFSRVLSQLLTEWYMVGASLLALGGIDAAIFGLSPGTIFPVDGFAQRVVAFGAIAAGIGILFVSWFLVLYSGANSSKFKRRATDVYGRYFFFCLTCRLPMLCLFLSASSLMVFLLSIAWTAWPTAVLVMSFGAGVLFTLQYLVYGCHRFINFVTWSARSAWWAVRSRRQTWSREHRCQEVQEPAPGRVEVTIVEVEREIGPEDGCCEDRDERKPGGGS